MAMNLCSALCVLYVDNILNFFPCKVELSKYSALHLIYDFCFYWHLVYDVEEFRRGSTTPVTLICPWIIYVASLLAFPLGDILIRCSCFNALRAIIMFFRSTITSLAPFATSCVIFSCLYAPTPGKESYILNVFSYVSSGELVFRLSYIYRISLWLYASRNCIGVWWPNLHTNQTNQDWYQQLNTTWSVLYMKVELHIGCYSMWWWDFSCAYVWSFGDSNQDLNLAPRDVNACSFKF